MLPFIEILPGFFIYTFGLTLAVCFFAFLWNLKRLGKRFGYSFQFFTQNIIYFFLSIFIFSRLFYIISRWSDMRFISDPLQFFLVSDYSFSLFGAIFGFLIVLKILTKLEKSSITRYIDGVVLSFLFVGVIGYVGAFLGGQIYGEPTSFGIEIRYSHPYTPVEYQVPVFPLPIVYAMMSFILFSGLYIYSLFSRKQGLIGYLGLALFSVMVLIFDTFNGKNDMLSAWTVFNLPQVFSLILGAWALYHLVDVLRTEKGGQDAII